MELPPLGNVDFTPTPEVFHSDETGKPFASCSMCGETLAGEGRGYLIEKGFSRGETMFEYAICSSCHGSMQSELSPASLKRIEHYFDERVNLVERRKQLAAEAPGDPEAWLSRCALSGDELGEDYHIYGQFDGGDLVFAYLPYAISGKELENIGQILSKETRERLDDFVDDVLGIPGDGLRIPVLL